MAQNTTGPLGKLREAADRTPGTKRLFEEAERYLSSQAGHLLHSATRKLGQTVERMTQGEGGGLGAVVEGGKQLAQGKSPGAAVGKGLFKGAKDKVMGALGGGGGGNGGGGGGGGGGSGSNTKSTTIIEDIDVGVPVRVAYNQWTEFADFAEFTKGVESANKKDDVSSDWRAKIFLSSRTWTAEITEQIPDERIAWTSTGPKGTNNGAVTFHPLGENLTKVLLVVEYYPTGFFEKTANLWRAQGRRLRLDFKHYRRHVMMRSRHEEVDGYRGEIRDGEVVVEDEDARAEEEREEGAAEEPEEGEEEEYEEGEPEEDEEENGDEDEDEYEYEEDEEENDEEDGEDDESSR